MGNPVSPSLSLSLFIGSGVFVGMLGVAYFADIHHLAYYIVIQIFVGVFEVTDSYKTSNYT